MHNIYYQFYTTPLGDMIAYFLQDKLLMLDFCDKNTIPIFIKKLQESFKLPVVQSDIYSSQLQIQLDEYFAGKRKIFSIPLHMQGTHFQMQVWKSLLEIPYGSTWSYKQQAVYVNKENAFRAVAHANSKNPFSIIIPCHRVIASNGALQGYAGGLHRKKYLLDLEHAYK